MRKFTKYPANYVKANQRILAYVTDEEDKAWDLLDAWFEKAWGKVPYNESARQILIDEFPITYSESGDPYEYDEGTGSVVANLKDHEVYYTAWNGEGEEYGSATVKYTDLDDMIAGFIQPLHDGKASTDRLQEICEDSCIFGCEPKKYL